MRPDSQTPTFDEIIRDILEERLYDVNTSMPGRVLSIDENTGLLTVEPCYMRKFRDDDQPVKIPPLEGVILADLRAGDAIISMPVKKDDFVTLIFSQRSMEKWKDSGRTESPGDPRLHHISDAIAYPGAYPVSKQLKTDRTALQIKFGGTKITLKKDQLLDLECSKAKIHMDKDGKFSIGNGSVNLLKLFKDGLTQAKATSTAIQAATFPSALGPTGTVINVAQFIQIDTALDKIMELLNQIISE